MLNNLDERFQDAVQDFWDTLDRQKAAQQVRGVADAGSRGAVTGGQQMASLERLVRDIVVDAGLSNDSVFTHSKLELPGYYRPEKMWDLLVVADGQLIAAVELKSHLGPSIGNNFNNRTEEVIGNAEDVWEAFREGRLGMHPAPLLAWLMLLEDYPKVHQAVRNSEPHFKVDPVLAGSTYAQRYQVLCERLILQRKYGSTCLTLTTRDHPTRISSPTPGLSFLQFAAAIEAHVREFVSAK